MNQFLHMLCAVLVGVIAVGCRSTTYTPEREFAGTLTHAGLFHDLKLGEYAGVIAISNLVQYGDHGLGTFDRLDGEMIVFDGAIYRADVNGMLQVASPTNTSPFAVVTYFQPQSRFDIAQVDQDRFKRALDMHKKHVNIPQAIQVQGLFSTMTLRSVPAQDQPWRPLDEALNKSARSYVLTNVSGVMVGYDYPEYLNVMHPPGHHFHFVNESKTIGGHVLDFTIAHARIAVDPSPRLHVLLATNLVETPKSTRVIPKTRPPVRSSSLPPAGTP